MHIHYLQHVPFEGLGSIEQWARQSGHALTRTRLYAGEPLPEPDAIDWLIVLGGPMGVHDDVCLPWLIEEKHLIEQAISAGRAVLGICLGAQLIAHVLGANVYRCAQEEIGWFPIEPTAQAAGTLVGRVLPPRIEAFHWHSDTFDLPTGAVHLARSAACVYQAFLYADRVLGLQFHLETTPDSAKALIDNSEDALVSARYIQQGQDMLADPTRFQRINDLMARVLDGLPGRT
jgi:GMP synthase-like glutamine amidotransferase